MAFDFGPNLRIALPATNNYNNTCNSAFNSVKKTQKGYKYLNREIGLQLQYPFTFSIYHHLITGVKSHYTHTQEERIL